MSPIRVLAAASGAHWDRILEAHCAGRGHGVEVVGRCHDPGELRARLVLDRPDAVALDAGGDWLDAVVVDACLAAGAAVVVVAADRDDPRPRRLGCDAVVSADRVEALVAALRVSARLRARRGRGRRRSGPRRGAVVAVWGPKGGTGRTTIAVNLAWELALAGFGCVLVDADTTGGNVALGLGLAETPSIAELARTAGRGLAADDCLDPYPRPIPALAVVPGLTSPVQWPQVRDADLRAVLDALARLAAVVVVDVGACLEDDDELLTQAWPWRRNQAARGVLGAADAAVAVVGCDPASARHAVAAGDDLAALVDPARVVVVVNKVLDDPRAGADVAARLERRCGWKGGSHLAPLDPAAPLAAWAGRALAEAAPGAPLRRSTAAVARALAAGLGLRAGIGFSPAGDVAYAAVTRPARDPVPR